MRGFFRSFRLSRIGRECQPTERYCIDISIDLQPAHLERHQQIYLTRSRHYCNPAPSVHYSRPGMTKLSRSLSRNNILFKRQFENVSKTAVIAIAAVATVLVVALISGCVFCCLRRRGGQNKSKGYGKSDSTDRSVNNLHDPVSKTPLMRQDNQSQMSEYTGVPAPRYDEEDIGMSASIPRRSLSGRSMQSVPPSYSAATHAGMDRTNSQNSHRPRSSYIGSDGLRPLMLLNSQQSYDGDDRDDGEERGRSGYPTNSNRSSLVVPLRPAGRPRAGSRFREEDLDM